MVSIGRPAVVIAGASVAGSATAKALRRHGYDGRIVAVGAEPHLPYDRPPLSKEFLAGTAEAPDITLRKQGDDDLHVAWRLGPRATALDVAAREVTLADGSQVGF